MPEPQPAAQFVDLRQQRDAAELGMWVFLATEVLFFGGLILTYWVYRLSDPAGFAEAARHTKILIGTANTAILLTSSFLVAWAATVTRLNAGRFAAILLWSAAALGLLFLVFKGVEYKMEYDEHLLPGLDFAVVGAHAQISFQFFSFYLIATALHAVHVAVGIIALGVIGLRSSRNAYSDRYYTPITVAGLYWHFVDVVWIFLFALIYLTGRGP
jgi:cytochrome c oxidase subunit III